LYVIKKPRKRGG